jgi:hypothetical protein
MILIGVILSSIMLSESYASGRDDSEMKYLLQGQHFHSGQALRHRQPIGKQKKEHSYVSSVSKKSPIQLAEDNLISALNEVYRAKKQAITSPEVIARLIEIHGRTGLENMKESATECFDIPPEFISDIVKVYFPDEEASPRKTTGIVILDKADNAGTT